MALIYPQNGDLTKSLKSARKKVPQSARLSAGGGVQKLKGQCPNARDMNLSGASLSSEKSSLRHGTLLSHYHLLSTCDVLKGLAPQCAARVIVQNYFGLTNQNPGFKLSSAVTLIIIKPGYPFLGVNSSTLNDYFTSRVVCKCPFSDDPSNSLCSCGNSFPVWRNRF